MRGPGCRGGVNFTLRSAVCVPVEVIQLSPADRRSPAMPKDYVGSHPDTYVALACRTNRIQHGSLATRMQERRRIHEQ